MKKLITILTTVLMFSTTAYAGTKPSRYGYNIAMETNEFSYNGKTAEYDTFECKDMKYVPLRAVSNFLGKEVGYDEATGSVNISDSETAEYLSSSVSDEKSGTAKVVYTEINYNGIELKDISTDFTSEVKYKQIKTEPILNYNGSIYVPLKWLTEGYELLREYDGNKVRITEPSDRLKFIPNAKVDYVGYSEELDNSEGIIDEELIEEAVLRQWNHCGEPNKISTEVKTVYYEGKPSIAVEVSILNGYSYLQGGAYEVLQ